MSERRPLWLQGWRLLLVSYVVLLGASHLWQWISPEDVTPADNQKITEVYTVSGDSLLKNKPVKIAYIDTYAGDLKNPPVVLLLHGSPVGVPMFSELIPKLSSLFRVIAPDLPGYDASTRDLPDYSINSYSAYMHQFLNRLAISEAHLVGYSLGGGIAIDMAHEKPQSVQSVVMLSAIGVQELELMGSYTLNHAIHGVQFGLLWLLHEAVPHFGLLDRFPLNIPYARSFYDSDQRPLRNYLQQFKKPMLIQHGKEDGLVPLAAAREHHRIVPQSELKLYEGGHGIVLSDNNEVAADLASFIQTVQKGKALTYTDASPQRIAEAKKPFEKVDFAKFEGVTLLIIMIIIALATLVSEDLTCIGAGLMAARGLIGFWPVTLACLIGIFLGDMALYFAGRMLGRPAVKKAPFKWFVSEKDLRKSSDWFDAKGPVIIIASRFLPGSRFPTYFSAGVIGAGFWMFSLYFLLAAIVWTPLLVGLSMLVGTELIRYFSVYQYYAVWVFLGTVVFLFLIAKIIIPAFSYRGRRLLLSRYRRLAIWEFWSPYVLYIPVCCYIAYLWAKHRSLTVFTAANPGIPEGGFVGESKKQILDLFGDTGMLAEYRLLPSDLSSEEQINGAEAFMSDYGLVFPIILKPDAGQRGAGVVIARNSQELRQAIREADYDQIVQKYIEGEEYGVFYYRYRDEEKGRIFSVTVKKLLRLTGDGKRTLEKLILDDERAVCLAKKHFAYHKDHLYEVPEAKEEIKLVDLGTHARGAVFEDGASLITPELEDSLDALSKKADGFYFGRYDIRTPSEEDFVAGKNLKIIEVNGVTSESTNIYDKKNSFFDAQVILRRQWRIAYEIGVQNAKRGVPVSSVQTLVKSLLQFKSK